MRDLAIKSRVLGDGYYYLPVDLWPAEEPVVIHKNDWKVIGSITKRPAVAGAEGSENFVET